LLSGNDNALFNLYQALPKAIEDFLNQKDSSQKSENSALNEITESANESK